MGSNFNRAQKRNATSKLTRVKKGKKIGSIKRNAEALRTRKALENLAKVGAVKERKGREGGSKPLKVYSHTIVHIPTKEGRVTFANREKPARICCH